jgi:large subunit ribosomal protein L30
MWLLNVARKQASYKMVKKDDKTIIVKQTKSLIGSTKKQISSMKGLGLRRINHTVSLVDTPEIRGMIKVVRHMVEVSN